MFKGLRLHFHPALDSSRWQVWDVFHPPPAGNKHGSTSWSESPAGGGGGDRETHRSTEALQDLHSLGVQGASKRPLWFGHLPVFLFKIFWGLWKKFQIFQARRFCTWERACMICTLAVFWDLGIQGAEWAWNSMLHWVAISVAGWW